MGCMPAKEIITLFEFGYGRVFKGIQFINVRNVGDPVMKGLREDLKTSVSRSMGW